jgi:HlyD family secretion protein
LIRLAVLAGLVGAGFALRATVFAPKPVEVRVVAVERGAVESTVTNSRAGTIRARRRARLSPEAAGRVVELPHREGERVKTGELLVRLSSSSQTARLGVAERAHEAAEAQETLARTRTERAAQEFQRGMTLARGGLVTTDDLERLESAGRVATAGFEAASARVKQAAAEVTLAKAELEKCLLRSPFSGVLGEVAVELGEWITPSPSMGAMATLGVIDLIDTSSIYISAPMDEVDSAVIAAELRARVALDPYPGENFQGRVTRVASYVRDVEAQNRTVEVEVELADSERSQRLLPGTSADVVVILEVRDGVLRIPSAALVEGGRVLIFEDGVLSERTVEIGLKNWDFAEVTAGLKEGERVVTSLGKQEVKAGVEAVVVSETP